MRHVQALDRQYGGLYGRGFGLNQIRQLGSQPDPHLEDGIVCSQNRSAKPYNIENLRADVQCRVGSKDRSSLAHLRYKRVPEPSQLFNGALAPQSLRRLLTPGVEVLTWKVDKQSREPCVAVR